MAFTYCVSYAGRQVHVVATGTFNAADCIRLVKRILTDSHVRPDSTALVDLRDAVFLSSDRGDVLRIAAAMEEAASMCRNNIALVAKGGLILLAELLATHVRNTAHIPMRVFADAEAAEAFCKE